MTYIDFSDLSSAGKTVLLNEAERTGRRPSEVMLRLIEDEAWRRGIPMNLTTADKMKQPTPKKLAITK